MSNTVYYIICAILSVGVLMGISLMSKVKTAVAGNMLSAVCVFLGVFITLLYNEILSVWSLYLFILSGIIIGSAFASRVKMIQMPQFVALLNGVGGFASALVGVLTLLGVGLTSTRYPVFVNMTSVLAIIVGTITMSGSLVAAGKLHKKLPQKPVLWNNHTAILNISLSILLLAVVYSAFQSTESGQVSGTYILLIVSVALSLLFGVAFSIRVGGADMPITISLLNSLSGVAGSIAGMAVNDLLLVAVGGIVGASGLFLTQIMCKSMNRSLADILTGRTSSRDKLPRVDKSTDANETALTLDKSVEVKDATPIREEKSTTTELGTEGEPSTREETPRDPKEILIAAKTVIIVPGYGMALAQAQHLVRELADKLENNGALVKYAIHPVAGRMPGHMNVLLAEADVSYEKLYEMDSVNDEFAQTDVAIVIGANDVLNPSARDAVDTPIYGMPVLNVDQAKEIFICNYDLNPGYSGVDNPLYARKEGVHLFLGDAKESLALLVGYLT